jgi:hypothetical protein
LRAGSDSIHEPAFFYSIAGIENIEDALDWVDRNQIGKRNLSPDDFKIISGRIYNRRKKNDGQRGPEKLPQFEEAFTKTSEEFQRRLSRETGNGRLIHRLTSPKSGRQRYQAPLFECVRRRLRRWHLVNQASAPRSPTSFIFRFGVGSMSNPNNSSFHELLTIEVAIGSSIKKQPPKRSVARSKRFTNSVAPTSLRLGLLPSVARSHFKPLA